MSNWIATNELRFVVEETRSGYVNVLQQKWEFDDPISEKLYTAWRDVPVVEEE